MNRIYCLILFSIITGNVLAQGSSADSPSFNFGNSIQGPGGIDSSSINAVLAFKKLQDTADADYKAEDYQRAFKRYHQLAKYNDKYSQYRIASMYAKGLGVEKNMVEAYAWTYVAAETKQKGFVNYHVSIRSKLNDSELQEGKNLASEYLKDYGTFAVASDARKLIRKQKRQCTGSRVGSSCDRISTAGINCGATSQGVIGRECLTLGAVGLPSVAGLQPKDLRDAENQLERLMDTYNPGSVELGELELIDD